MNSCIVIRLAVYRLSVNVEFTLPDIATSEMELLYVASCCEALVVV